MEAILGNASLWEDISNYGVNNSYSALFPVLNGASPDDSFSNVPYEKGFQFLVFLETVLVQANVPGVTIQDFLRFYINRHAQSSIAYQQLKSTWSDYINGRVTNATLASQILNSVNWTLWIEQPGLSPVPMNFSTNTSIQAVQLADSYIKLAGNSSPDNFTVYNSYFSNLKVVFLLELLARQSEVTLAIMQRIDADLNITNDANPEVKQRWFPLAIAVSYYPAFQPAHIFVSVQGRMKYINPIYLALIRNGYRNIAIEWFAENADFYHPIAVAQLKKMLYQQLTASEE